MDGSDSLGRRSAAPAHARRARSWPPAASGSRDTPPASQAGVRIPPFMTRQGYCISGRWPLQDFLEFGALVSAVPCARLHARHVLWEWGLARLGESAELLVTELISNAVKASRVVVGQASAVRLWLVSDRARILILVWDASPQPPVRADASGEAENGRGLMLVEAISEQWGWYCSDDSSGKFVWAILEALRQANRTGTGNRQSQRQHRTPGYRLTAPSRARSRMRTACWKGLATSPEERIRGLASLVAPAKPDTLPVPPLRRAQHFLNELGYQP
jgi:anti-sigma regulatory factor (Ser/Thr protein kinase)